MKNKLKNMNKKKLVIVILLVITIIRLLIGMQLPLAVYQDQLYDDTLMHDYAFSLRSFNWLGSYNQLTLVKGISFSVFMALCNFLYIPYSMGLTVLYIFAIICIIKAIRPKFNEKTLVGMYILLLFSPVMFDSFIAQRIYRNAILPSATLLVFAGFIGMFLRKDKPIKENIFFILLSIFSLIFFWHIKEDSIWILPFTITISLITIIYWIINDRKKIILKVILVLLPFISLFTFNRIYSFVNYKLYGVNVVSDKSGGNFSRMIKDIFLIEDSENNRNDIWVTSSTINKLYEVSPTFKKLKPTMDNFDGWLEEDGEVKGDLVIWRIRAVISRNGLYKNAKKADDFCKKVSIEIEEAFETGKLKKDNRIHITSQMRGIDTTDIFISMKRGIKWFYEIGDYDRIDAANNHSRGDPEKVMYVQAFTASNILLEDTSYEYDVVNKVNMINDVYKFLGPVFTILSIICFVFLTIKLFIDLIKKRFIELDLYIVNVGILLSIILLLVEVALFSLFFDDRTLFYFRNFYCASAFPLIQTFKYMIIFHVIEIIFKDKKIKKRRMKK